MKKELIIISDLWGIKKSDWLAHYKQILSPEYEIKFYDSCELGEIDLSQYGQENIHKQFVDFGIERAVSNLLKIEKEPKLYIGCSIGGVIGWRAALLGLPIQKLITISATRLRMESEKPSCPIQIYFGELDKYQPDSNWFDSIKCNCNAILKGGHEIYKEALPVTQILNDLKEKEWVDLR